LMGVKWLSVEWAWLVNDGGGVISREKTMRALFSRKARNPYQNFEEVNLASKI